MSTDTNANIINMAPSAKSSYDELVSSLHAEDILNTWKDVTPVEQITDVATSKFNVDDEGVFEGHDEEQIKLMEELCIVLDYNDTPIGAGTKKLCHLMDNINRGLLHRAFSVFLFNDKQELLLQQRADEKITFPNMWTNTCCSHPLCIKSELGIGKSSNYNELTTSIHGAKVAAQRKLFHELGIEKEDCPLENFHYLTRIHYKALSGEVQSKWGEHEIDYILILKTKDDIKIDANLNEVRDYKYVSQEALKQMFQDETLVFTPWFKLICETLLFKWWDNLSNLSEFEDDKIHRLL